jgi:ATP-dependent Clp protease adaptor protein ClpS
MSTVIDTTGDIDVMDKVEKKQPRKWNVILHNDDFTSMEFVVTVLMEIFNKSLEESTALMLDIHQKGKGIAGTYTFEVASHKKDETEVLARYNGYPLKITVEET